MSGGVIRSSILGRKKCEEKKNLVFNKTPHNFLKKKKKRLKTLAKFTETSPLKLLYSPWLHFSLISKLGPCLP